MTNEDLRKAVVKMVEDIAPHMDGIRDAIAEFGDVVDKASRDGYVGDLYRTRYTVTGRGAFPMDMLRYAVSWPNDEQDARRIEESLEHGDSNDQFTVRLCKYHRDRSPSLCEERWESKFRWKVLNTDAHEIETTRL
jgi:hypothetical protein